MNCPSFRTACAITLTLQQWGPVSSARDEIRHDSPPLLLEVRKIWDHAKHNAFTDLIHFNDQWFCVFREGDSHVSTAGKLRVLASPDGREWTSASLIEKPGADLRDAKITITPAGQLMLSGAAALPSPSPFRHQSLTWFSTDGKNWSESHEVGDKDIWLWRTTWREDTAYGIGYGTGQNRGILRLYRSHDGKSFDTLVPDLIDDPFPNETSILFRKDGVAHCLLRRDGQSKTAMLGTAKPPFRDWTWKDLGVRIGAPHMIEIPGGRTVAAVRLYDGGARTSLCWLNPKAGTLTEFLKLPSGGDSSYAGLAWHDNHLWVSYYSGHEHNHRDSDASTAIYLAKVALGSGTASISPLIFEGNFETDTTGIGRLGNINIEQALDRTRIAESPVRSGRRALEINLDRNTGHHRTDFWIKGLSQKIKMGKEAWYGFSTFWPDSWEPDTQPELFAQWIGHGLSSPPLGIYLYGESYRIKKRWSSEPDDCKNLWSGKVAPDRAAWTDWVFHVKWSPGGDGFVEAWKNGSKIVADRGPNCGPPAHAPYFKFGLYKWPWKQPAKQAPSVVSKRRVIFDEIRIGDARANRVAVSPP